MTLRNIVAGTQRAHNPGRRKFAGQLAGTAAAGAALGASAAQALPLADTDADPYRVPADQLPIVLSTDAGARGWCRLVSHPGLRVTINGRPLGATFADTAAKLAEGYDITGRELAELVDDGGYPPGLVRALYRDKTVGGEVGSAGDCWAVEQPRREIRHGPVHVYVDGQPAAQWFEGMPASERRYWLEQQPASVDCQPQCSREGIKWKGPTRSQAFRIFDPAKDARGTARERYNAALRYKYEQLRKHRVPQPYQLEVLDMLDHDVAPPEPFAMHPPEEHEGATIVPSRFNANGRLQFDDDDQAGTVEAFSEANHSDFEAINNQLDSWANDVQQLGTALESLQKKGNA